RDVVDERDGELPQRSGLGHKGPADVRGPRGAVQLDLWSTLADSAQRATDRQSRLAADRLGEQGRRVIATRERAGAMQGNGDDDVDRRTACDVAGELLGDEGAEIGRECAIAAVLKPMDRTAQRSFGLADGADRDRAANRARLRLIATGDAVPPSWVAAAGAPGCEDGVAQGLDHMRSTGSQESSSPTCAPARATAPAPSSRTLFVPRGAAIIGAQGRIRSATRSTRFAPSRNSAAMAKPMKSEGKMQPTVGSMMRIGARAAFSSARWRRSVRSVSDWIRRTLDIDTPSWSAWMIAEMKPWSSFTSTRSLIPRSASCRDLPTRCSAAARLNSSLSGPFNFSVTFTIAASKPSPASTEMVRRSSAS